MKIGIIDADLIGRSKHRFPNLACMKLSGYYKEMGHDVVLKTDYDNLDTYDKVFISKVFTDTPIDENILALPNVEWGGSGFYYDKAPFLPYEIEHHMPDYTLYNDFVNEKVKNGSKKSEFEYYTDYSIGFTTRGCFRKCPFCINKNYNYVELHSPLEEFYDPSRKYICMLDDNILGFPKWREVFDTLIATNRYFQYKQGMDERVLTEEKCEVLSKVKYKGDYIFAFDDINDKEIIQEKLKLLKKYIKKTIKFYVFCGFDRNDKWDRDFWKQDIIDTFERIKILMQHGCLPYIMRFNRYEESPYKGIYITLARWCNQPNLFKKKSFREYCKLTQEYVKTKTSAPMRYMNAFENKHIDIANKYFDLKFEDLNTYKKTLK